MNIKKSILVRVRVAFLCVMVFAVCVAAKISHIQFVDGDKWEKMSEEINFDYKKIKATRGNIYSDNGSLLATSLPFYKVAIDPTLAKSEIFKSGIDSLAMMLSRYYKDKSTAEYKQLIKDARVAGKQYVVVNRKQINYQAKKEMMRWPIFREGRYRGGVIFEKIDVRYRPFSNLSRRTVGFVNEDGKGAGLEYSFDDVLSGQDGEALFQKIAGSTWKPDEELLAAFINQSTNIKFIIAAHEVSAANINRIHQLLKKPAISFSKVSESEVDKYEVLIIDSVGLLSSLYRYGNVAYIGGGFGVGIHNILEAATFGLPVIFGPNYKKFKEAVDMISVGGAFSVSNAIELRVALDKLIDDKDERQKASQICRK